MKQPRQSRHPTDSLSPPKGREGWGEVGDSRTLADTHLTLPIAPQWVPSLSPLKGGEGRTKLAQVAQYDRRGCGLREAHGEAPVPPDFVARPPRQRRPRPP